MVAPELITYMGPLTAMISTRLDFALIFLPIEHIVSCSNMGRNKLYPFSKISADVFSLLDFKVSPHSQFLDLSIEKILLCRCLSKLL